MSVLNIDITFDGIVS